MHVSAADPRRILRTTSHTDLAAPFADATGKKLTELLLARSVPPQPPLRMLVQDAADRGTVLATKPWAPPQLSSKAAGKRKAAIA